MKMRFKDEEEEVIILFEFHGVICDYNGVDINQTSHNIDMFCETYINFIMKHHNQDINTKLSPSGDNKNNKINVEATAASLVKISQIDPTNRDSLQPLPECIKPTKLYNHHKIILIPSDSIEKNYQQVGPKEGTTHH